MIDVAQHLAACDPEDLYSLVRRIYAGCRKCSLCRCAPTEENRSICPDCARRRNAYRKARKELAKAAKAADAAKVATAAAGAD